MQIYNENIYDLLKDNPNALPIRESPVQGTRISWLERMMCSGDGLSLVYFPPPFCLSHISSLTCLIRFSLVLTRSSGNVGVYVEDLSEYVCRSFDEMMDLLQQGQKRLVFAETKMNRTSSRSHAVCRIIVEKRERVRLLRLGFGLVVVVCVEIAC